MLRDFQSKINKDQEKQAQKREEVMYGRISLHRCADQIHSVAVTFWVTTAT